MTSNGYDCCGGYDDGGGGGFLQRAMTEYITQIVQMIGLNK